MQGSVSQSINQVASIFMTSNNQSSAENRGENKLLGLLISCRYMLLPSTNIFIYIFSSLFVRFLRILFAFPPISFYFSSSPANLCKQFSMRRKDRGGNGLMESRNKMRVRPPTGNWKMKMGNNENDIKTGANVTRMGKTDFKLIEL